MKFYWKWRSVPELADLTPAEKRIAWRTCYRRSLRHWQAWAGIIISVIIGVLLGAAFLWAVVRIAFDLVGVRTRNGLLATYFIAGFGCGGIIVGVTEFLRWRLVADQILEYFDEFVEHRKQLKGHPPPPEA